MTMAPMVDHVARKARSELSDSKNMEQMYKTFVHSTIEYGNPVYLFAADTHKQKLDRIQARAAKVGNFSVGTLDSRRCAALIGFTFKLLDGCGREFLNDFVPTITEPEQSITRQSKVREIVPAFDFRDTSKQYDPNIGGQIPVVRNAIPQELALSKETDEWQKKTKNCQRFLTGEKLADPKPEKM